MGDYESKVKALFVLILALVCGYIFTSFIWWGTVTLETIPMWLIRIGTILMSIASITIVPIMISQGKQIPLKNTLVGYMSYIAGTVALFIFSAMLWPIKDEFLTGLPNLIVTLGLLLIAVTFVYIKPFTIMLTEEAD